MVSYSPVLPVDCNVRSDIEMTFVSFGLRKVDNVSLAKIHIILLFPNKKQIIFVNVHNANVCVVIENKKKIFVMIKTK